LPCRLDRLGSSGVIPVAEMTALRGSTPRGSLITPGANATIPPLRSASNTLVQLVNGSRFGFARVQKAGQPIYLDVPLADRMAVEECGSNLLER
jgi:hypothetical protein